jgi:hypothetical protein
MRTLALILLLLPLSAARAETIVVESIEWRTAAVPLVVAGKVFACSDVQPKSGGLFRDVTINIEERFKGSDDGKSVTFRLQVEPGERTGKDWKESGRSYVFFLHKGSKDHHRPAQQGKWVLRGELIDLGKPDRVYTADMKCAETGKEVLDLVRGSARLATSGGKQDERDPSKRGTRDLLLDVPTDAAIFNQLYSGSAVWMRVPAEEKYRPRLEKMTRSTDVWDRSNGAWKLGKLPPTAATIKLLTGLHKDAGEAQQFEGRKLVRIIYPVRRSAYDALVDLGQKPAKPVLERDPTPEEMRKAQLKAQRAQNP